MICILHRFIFEGFCFPLFIGVRCEAFDIRLLLMDIPLEAFVFLVFFIDAPSDALASRMVVLGLPLDVVATLALCFIVCHRLTFRLNVAPVLLWPFEGSHDRSLLERSAQRLIRRIAYKLQYSMGER